MNPDPNLCPLCGAGNRCGMQADPQSRDCWCRDAEFGAAIARLPPQALGKACICARCALEAAQAEKLIAARES